MPQNPQIRIRVAPEVKKALERISKLHNTKLNDVVILLINEVLHKKPRLSEVLFGCTCQPQTRKLVLSKYRELNSRYSEIAFLCRENCLELQDINHFMDAADEFIQIITKL